jgi:hypothetical protein
MKLTYIKALVVLVVVSCALLVGCQKDYFIDTGVHKAKYDGTILNYFQDKPVLFDSLVMVIKAAGMDDTYNNENVTFFAPTNTTIFKAIKSLNENLRTNGRDTVSKIAQVKASVWKEMLSLYTFKGSYLLKDIPQVDTLALNAFPGQGYTSYGSRPMNIGVFYNDASGVKYVGYRQLILSFIRDFSNPKTDLINAVVATSDIQPNNGVIHVIRGSSHFFGFESSRFIAAAISAGIIPIAELATN